MVMVNLLSRECGIFLNLHFPYCALCSICTLAQYLDRNPRSQMRTQRMHRSVRGKKDCGTVVEEISKSKSCTRGNVSIAQPVRLGYIVNVHLLRRGVGASAGLSIVHMILVAKWTHQPSLELMTKATPTESSGKTERKLTWVQLVSFVFLQLHFIASRIVIVRSLSTSQGREGIHLR